MVFADREDAGRRLAERLESLGPERPVVVGMARGGVPVAAEVARRLGAPLDVLVVRKVGAPGHPEFALGAVAGGVLRLDERAIEALRIPRDAVDRIVAAETEVLRRREARYRGDRPPPDLRDRTVILVDDGLATGMSARAALDALRQQGPRRVVFAAPVCAPESAAALDDAADLVVCVAAPPDFRAVSLWYDDFSPTSDEEVIDILRRTGGPGARREPTGRP